MFIVNFKNCFFLLVNVFVILKFKFWGVKIVILYLFDKLCENNILEFYFFFYVGIIFGVVWVFCKKIKWFL